MTDRITLAAPHGMKPPSRKTAGFSLVEAIIAILIVATMVVAVLSNVGASQTSQYALMEQERAHALAQDLIAEIINQPYEEPEDTPTFGREPSENGGKRERWDDVDDYKDWSSSPPENPDNTALPDLTGWTRAATVIRVNPDNLSQTSASETGAKHITVTVKHGDRVIATATAVRTSAR